MFGKPFRMILFSFILLFLGFNLFSYLVSFSLTILCGLPARPTAWICSSSYNTVYESAAQYMASLYTTAKADAGSLAPDICTWIQLAQPGLPCDLNDYDNDIQDHLHSLVEEAGKFRQEVLVNITKIDEFQRTLAHDAEYFALLSQYRLGSRLLIILVLVILTVLCIHNTYNSSTFSPPNDELRDDPGSIQHPHEIVDLTQLESQDDIKPAVKEEEEQLQLEFLSCGPFQREHADPIKVETLS